MTDEVLDKEVASDPEVMPDLTNEGEPKAEKMLPVSRVEELVKKAILKGRDSMQDELDALKAENDKLKASAGSMGGMAAPQPVDPEHIINAVMAKMQKQHQEDSEQRAQHELNEQAKRIAGDYHSRMSAGKDAYEDFDSVMADFNPQNFPNLVMLATQVDNTPDVMYELNKNPNKFASLVLMSERDPAAAQSMINKLSASIKANSQAVAQQKDVAPPLSRLSSSTTGQDNGVKTVRDFKDIYRG